MTVRGFVYFIRPVGHAGPVKIGFSRAPQARKAALMEWSPLPLEVVVDIPGDIDLEHRIQGLFAASHSHHEWFAVTPELADLVAKLAAGVAIADLIDMSAPIIPLYLPRKRTVGPNMRRYLSYALRVSRALRKHQRHEPADVSRILKRPADAFAPTPEQIRRLEEVIADPLTHGITHEPIARAA